MKPKPTTRRRFLRSNSALAGFFILPAGLRAASPNSRLCSAHIGVAGKGAGDTAHIAANPNTQVVALCDVDRHSLEGRGRGQRGGVRYQDAKRFRDYREMLATMGDKVDVVSVSTPDHTHFPATMAAIELGKHVYTQKPLTNNIAEARDLLEAAKKHSVVTQMGIQNQSTIGYRTATELVRGGLIGKVRRVHVWSFKDWGYDGVPYRGADPVPENLDWNLWVGTAPMRPYLEGKYHPSNWRRIIDFGCGTLGDMGIHIFDTPFRALGLAPPVWAEATCRAPNGFSLPTKGTVRFGFKPTPHTSKDFEWIWYDGDHAPPADHPDLADLEGQKVPRQGAMFVGEEGRMLLEHIAGPRFFPRSVYGRLAKPDLPKKVNHYGQWIDSVLGGVGSPTASFEYAAPLTESVLLGVVAGRYPGKRIDWDSAAMRVTNVPGANRFVRRDQREF